MATIRKIPVLWTGLAGLPGYSVFYSQGAADATADLVTFFNAVKAIFPLGLSWQIPNAGDTLDDASGHLTGGWSAAGGGTVLASSASGFAAGTGAFIKWGTGVLVNNRRLQGRTFMAPLINTQYETNGTLISGALTLFQTSAAVLMTAGKLVIWHRPPTGTFAGGSSALISSVQVPDQVTSLRTRRT